MKLSLVIIGAAIAPASAAMLGGVKDEHGCYPSAGYSWCESSQKCIRAWEEGCSATESATNATSATDNAPASVVGAATDSSGCLTSAGYQFCPELKECVRFWESNADGATYESLCPTLMKTLEGDATGRRSLQIGGTADENGCLTSAGYSWCESSSKCLRAWEEDCVVDDAQPAATTTTTAAAKLVGGKTGDCCVTCGYHWCAAMDKCVQPWMVDNLASSCPVLFKTLMLTDDLSTHSR